MTKRDYNLWELWYALLFAGMFMSDALHYSSRGDFYFSICACFSLLCWAWVLTKKVKSNND